MTLLDEISAYADKRLQGSTLTFALVAWVKGEPGNPNSVALCSPPAFSHEAVAALRTTADAVDKQQAGGGAG